LSRRLEIVGADGGVVVGVFPTGVFVGGVDVGGLFTLSVPVITPTTFFPNSLNINKSGKEPLSRMRQLAWSRKSRSKMKILEGINQFRMGRDRK
jgi:hypothetical protein